MCIVRRARDGLPRTSTASAPTDARLLGVSTCSASFTRAHLRMLSREYRRVAQSRSRLTRTTRTAALQGTVPNTGAGTPAQHRDSSQDRVIVQNGSLHEAAIAPLPPAPSTARSVQQRRYGERDGGIRAASRQGGSAVVCLQHCVSAGLSVNERHESEGRCGRDSSRADANWLKMAQHLTSALC